MRRLSANYVIPVSSPPIKNGIIELTDSGEIVKIIQPDSQNRELRKVEFYNGILVPGFINCHCHLELSSMKDFLKPKTGLIKFIKAIRKERNVQSEETRHKAAKNADQQMKNNGIVAVGDISNDAETFKIKKDSKIRYYTFIELFGLSQKDSKNRFDRSLKLLDDLQNEYQLEGSLTPHATYSVSKRLLNELFSKPVSADAIFSIHNQETVNRNERKIKRRAMFWTHIESIEIFKGIFASKRPLDFEVMIQKFPKDNNVLLVHNTYTTGKDIDVANKHLKHLYWVFCPKSNLYLENTLPSVDLFIEKGQKITLGTDSLASNSQLSVLQEILTILQNFPSVSLDEVIEWATINGAEALNMDNNLGSFEVGKKPGVNLIQNIDFTNWTLRENASVKSII